MASKPPIVAVLSGKGGTGKTLVSVNLAAAVEEALYLDCDVEEPNGHLFFKPKSPKETPVTVKIPYVDADLCTGCRSCVEFCAFNALAFVMDEVLVFEEICHSCGGCKLVCPSNAIREKDKIIGTVFSGTSEKVSLHTGCLRIGQASGIPLIKSLLHEAKGEDKLPVFIDCPPGSACAAMESIQDADFCVLVAEPTLFGAHNLAMVYELVVLFEKPFGVVLNKCQEGENPSEDFCHEHKIPILGRIPFDQDLAVLNSEGHIAVRENEGFRQTFNSLWEQIEKEMQHEATSDS